MIDFKRLLIVPLAVLPVSTGLGQAAGNSHSFAITDVTVIDSKGAEDRLDVTVVVRDGRILTVETAANALPAGVRERCGHSLRR